MFCPELNKDFNTKEEMFSELKKHKAEIISMKKAQILKSCEKGIGVNAKLIDPTKIDTQIKGLDGDDNYYYIAVNTTRILDNHKDLHVDGIWNKTVKEKQGKNYLVLDHELKVSSTVVKKEDVEMFTATIPFAALGKNYPGETEALIYKVPKSKIINQAAKDWLESGDEIQASVRMRYTDILFALNSEDPEDKAEKAVYQKYIDIVANKSDFEDGVDYFWPVKQAENVYESSLVLMGSNHVTGPRAGLVHSKR